LKNNGQKIFENSKGQKKLKITVKNMHQNSLELEEYLGDIQSNNEK